MQIPESNMNDSPQFLLGLVSWEKINQTRRVSVLNSGQTSFPPRWNKTCRYRACLLSASSSWRSGRSQGGVERGKGRTTLTANASRYIRARGTPVPLRGSAFSDTIASHSNRHWHFRLTMISNGRVSEPTLSALPPSKSNRANESPAAAF